MKFVPFCFLFLIALGLLPVEADYYKYKCNSQVVAEEAKKILEEKKFFIDFCSNCPPDKAGVRRVDIEKVVIEQKPCGAELKVTGKLVRGIKPPIFGGYCTEEIEVYNPSIKLEMEYRKNIDMAYSYVWNESSKRFETLSSQLSLTGREVCVQSIVLKK